MIFGRTGGMNEYGFCVTTSWGAPMLWPRGEGVPYFAVVRALLDRCRNVDEALQTLAGIPVAWCTNIIISDSSGEAALVEVAGADRGQKRLGKGTSETHLCATNHFTFPELQAFSAKRRRESITRRQTIESRIGASLPRVSQETVRHLLSEPYPDGLCLHHYSDGLGTLWSLIFDVTQRTVNVCFGNPGSAENPWRSFGLQDPVGITRYEGGLPDEPADPGFWEVQSTS
jgi:predicted choloylglycine hydrolase